MIKALQVLQEKGTNVNVSLNTDINQLVGKTKADALIQTVEHLVSVGGSDMRCSYEELGDTDMDVLPLVCLMLAIERLQ